MQSFTKCNHYTLFWGKKKAYVIAPLSKCFILATCIFSPVRRLVVVFPLLHDKLGNGKNQQITDIFSHANSFV